MNSRPDAARETLLSHIYGALADQKGSALIRLIYDRIAHRSGRSLLSRSQTEAFFFLLRLPCKNLPAEVDRDYLCELVEKSFHTKYLRQAGCAECESSRLDSSENDEANMDELKILSTLDTARSKCYPAPFKLIREENLVRTVLRQDRALRKLKSKLAETERKADLLAAEYFAERCAACYNEVSECDSGCNTERSSSPNSASLKGFVNRKKVVSGADEGCARLSTRARFSSIERAPDDSTPKGSRPAPHSMSMMWMCNPSTSLTSGGVLDSGSLRNEPGGMRMTERSDCGITVDSVCCSVTLQRSILPNSAQRCEPHSARSRRSGTFSAAEPPATKPKPLHGLQLASNPDSPRSESGQLVFLDGDFDLDHDLELVSSRKTGCYVQDGSRKDLLSRKKRSREDTTLPSAQPLCRSEYATVDVTVCRKPYTRSVPHIIRKTWCSVALNTKTPVASTRRRQPLKRLQLLPESLGNSTIQFNYKPLRTKRIVEYRMPFVRRIN